jgi:hypothetical protein
VRNVGGSKARSEARKQSLVRAESSRKKKGDLGFMIEALIGRKLK